MTRRKRTIPRWVEQQHRDSQAYACVEKILQGGCPKKTSAVREAAKQLGWCERSIFAALKRHERQMEFNAWSDRQWEIEHGLVQPTKEEEEAMMREAEDRYIQHYINIRRGK
jgi:DNA primase large subunit